MEAHEIQERVEAANRAVVSQGRIDWYERVVPGWWKQLKEFFADPVWRDGDLDEFCKRVFGAPEAEMRAFMEGEWRDYQPKAVDMEKEPPSPLKSGSVVSAGRETEKKVMSAAQRAKAYRERRRVGK